MKIYTCLFIGILLGAQIVSGQSESELFKAIVMQDSLFFKAYNECDLLTQEAYYSDSIEFYHDKGGLSTSKKDLLEGTKQNICGKVTRVLVKGSIEVSPIPGYGAIELGSHFFRNSREPSQLPKPSKFVIIWKKYPDKWIITRVISLH